MQGGQRALLSIVQRPAAAGALGAERDQVVIGAAGAGEIEAIVALQWLLPGLFMGQGLRLIVGLRADPLHAAPHKRHHHEGKGKCRDGDDDAGGCAHVVVPPGRDASVRGGEVKVWGRGRRIGAFSKLAS